MKAYLELFFTFAKIGAFMFGGGYAMLPLLERELIEKKGWTTQEDILNYFAIAQCTPGVIAVNTATFVGHKQKGVVGGIVATVGVIFVPMIIILTIALALQAFWGHPLVARIFSGIRIAVAALIVSAVIKLFKSSVKNWFGIVLYLLAFCAIAFLDVSPVVIVILAALSGLVYGRVQA